jgi:hypothetical protein
MMTQTHNVISVLLASSLVLPFLSCKKEFSSRTSTQAPQQTPEPTAAPEVETRETDVGGIVEIPPPEVTITEPLAGTKNPGSFTMRGTCSAYESETIVAISGELKNSPANAPCLNGIWSVEIELTAGIGSKALTASQTNDAGKVGTAEISYPGVFCGGKGTVTSPYQICDYDSLLNVSDFLESNFKLTKSVDAASSEGANSGAGFLPFGSALAPFSGSFDGNGLRVENLDIDRPTADGIGLFGYTSSTAQIKNLIVSGNVEGQSDVGLLVGKNTGSITNCSSSGSVAGHVENVGGLVGKNDGSSAHVKSSFSMAVVTGNSGNHVGGIVGQNSSDGELEDVYYQSSLTSGTDISSSGSNVGGLIGLNEESGSIENCYSADANVAGGTFVGGLVGSNGEGATVANCFATSVVTGTSIGAAVGKNAVTGALVNLHWLTGIGNSSCIEAQMDSDNIGTLTDCSDQSDVSTFYVGTNTPLDMWNLASDVWDFSGTGYPEFQ